MKVDCAIDSLDRLIHAECELLICVNDAMTLCRETRRRQQSS
jgi:hypothetical protein